MNSNKDNKYIMSYFCILLLLCGVHTISYIDSEMKLSNSLETLSMDAETGHTDSQHYLANGTLIRSRRAARFTDLRSHFPNAVSALAYGYGEAYYGFSNINLGAVIVAVIFMIIAARHLLC